MESSSDRARAFALALALHIGLFLLIWGSASWIVPSADEAAAGEPVQATLQMSAADLRRAAQAVAAAQHAPPTPKPPEAPKPQPIPVPKPQVADAPAQPVPQARLDKPDTVDQQAVSKLAEQPADKPAPEEQEQKNRQAQVDLTEQQIRQRIAERRQQLRAQIEAIQLQRDAAAKSTRLEEQRLQQLADRQAAATPAPARSATPQAAPVGNRGVDVGLLARYKADMLMTADGNWNHLGVPERTHCQVRFTQLTGGEVINVEFIACPYDAGGRETVDRALRKTPMPYAGYETVFVRQVTLDFCHPREECSP